MRSSSKIHPGSLFVVGFSGTSVPAPLLAKLETGERAGVILFGRNLDKSLPDEERMAQVRSLCASVHRASHKAGLPAIMSVDQEGGRVQRIRAPLPHYPAMGKLGEDPESLGRKMGQDLWNLGFNLNYAPVLDVHSNPNNPVIGDRAFGTTPDVVADRALAFLRGLRASSVEGCGKHFPGHGDTESDSHLTLPVVYHPLSRLRSLELIPFARAIEAGISMLMTAHVLYPDVDSVPATLSRRWLSEILRGELRYTGVVVSDDLDMKALANRQVGEVIIESLLAGCDAFLLCNDEEREHLAEEALIRGAEKDVRVFERIREAQERLAHFRKSLKVPGC